MQITAPQHATLMQRKGYKRTKKRARNLMGRSIKATRRHRCRGRDISNRGFGSFEVRTGVGCLIQRRRRSKYALHAILELPKFRVRGVCARDNRS